MRRRYSQIDVANAVNQGHPLNRGRVCWALNPQGMGAGGRLIDLCGRHHFAINGSVPFVGGSFPMMSYAANESNSCTLATPPTSISPTTQLTYAVWVTAISSGRMPLHRGGPSDDMWQIFCATGNEIRFALNANYMSATVATIFSGAKHRLVMSWDGATMRGYSNGVQIITRALSGTLTYDTSTIHIGRRATNGHAWNGLIWDFAVWNRGLSADEVMLDYRLGCHNYESQDSPINWMTRPSAQLSGGGGGGNRRRRTIICGGVV
jgi:hypothetical protein